ncbi:hypothetical protein R1sor_016318 [Riccia sorocarpa]|uniref:Reverse transcriptase domain-containing protein n=1 Tax=Riccia sorocarpa TaxID=122646 RepID=A0ABD3HIP3_9MARC
MEEIQRFYKELYKEEEESEEHLTKREEILSLVDRGLTEEQNRRLETEPDDELITEIVRELPQEKSPGLDGVTAEILVLGWDFMRQDCFWMVREVWRRKSLWGKDRKGVIKLIPKNERKHLLQNWRPITLLTTTYKIIAKIFAKRLKKMLPAIIDHQQTGFVAGRNIIENILSLRLAQEWAQESGQDCIFIKLDFMKAYDRIAHGYLWDSLKAMGIGAVTVERIRGLVTGGSATVHINGLFTREIELQRGVRQGCPLAPLLFAMSTQPLMRRLREEERRGNIRGLNIGEGRSLLHQLFADDTGICISMEEQHFTRLQEVIRDYEMASGARLNVQKSTIMQLKPGPSPDWLSSTDCELAGPGGPFVYLGVQTNTPVDERAIADSIVQKMMKKLNHWSNRLLSWPAKTILLKHVLAATPLYQLMSVGLCRDGIEGLERLCRTFLWGWNEEGSPKSSLVAWERVAQPKLKGGLGWDFLQDKADVLNVRLVEQIIRGSDAEWVQLARSFILRTLRKGSYQKERIQWTLQESMTLLPLTKVDGSPTLSRILASCYKVRKRLSWSSSGSEIGKELSWIQVLTLRSLELQEGVRGIPPRKEIGFLKKAGLESMEVAMEVARSGGWLNKLNSEGIYAEIYMARILEEEEEWFQKHSDGAACGNQQQPIVERFGCGNCYKEGTSLIVELQIWAIKEAIVGHAATIWRH